MPGPAFAATLVECGNTRRVTVRALDLRRRRRLRESDRHFFARVVDTGHSTPSPVLENLLVVISSAAKEARTGGDKPVCHRLCDRKIPSLRPRKRLGPQLRTSGAQISRFRLGFAASTADTESIRFLSSLGVDYRSCFSSRLRTPQLVDAELLE